jgi:hypothetical protein
MPRPHTSLGTREATVTIQQAVCLHPPYSTDLVSPNCHHFGPLKDELQGCHFADNDELNIACMKSSDASAESII